MKSSILFLLLIFLSLLARTELVLYKSDGTTYKRGVTGIDSIKFTPKPVSEGKKILFYNSDKSFFYCPVSEVDSICMVEDTMSFNGMKLILAKGKSFIMGDDESEFPQSKPAHKVSFTYDFWMDSTEVTQGDYDSLMAKHYEWYQKPDWLYAQGDNYPVYAISWYDAVLYCNARSKADNLDTIYSYTKRNDVIGSVPN